MIEIPEYLLYLLGGLYLLLQLAAIYAAIEALLSTRSTQSAIAWTLFLIMFPIFGLPIYLLFGGRKFSGYVSARRQGSEPLQQLAQDISTRIPEEARALFTDQEHDHRVLTRLAHLPFFAANKSRLLIDGKATFEAIFNAIESAKEYLLVQFYIVKNDGLGQQLQRLMIDRAKQGVRVYFLYDSIGSNALPGSYIEALQVAGVECSDFGGGGRSGGYPFRVNFRNHRKIVVVDGRIAFVGGHNVGDEYVGKSENPKLRPWRDTHVSVEGPAVLGVQLAFIKVVLVDNQVAGVGTANFDNRSFRLNFEITLLFVDRQCVNEVEHMLERDFESCREMKLQDITQRSIWFKLATRIARLFSPVL